LNLYVQIEIVSPKVLQGGIEGLLDIVGVVRVVPELGRDEQLLARNARLLDGITDSSLGTVDSCSVDMSVASLDSRGYSSTITLAWAMFVGEAICTVPGHPCPAKCQTQWLGSELQC
jgi:hypothetical protein